MKRIISFLLITSLFFNAKAQSSELNIVPDNINIKTGILSNGLTYYIKANGVPRKKLELSLVVKVGSIVEDEDQLGLAHFMEHMCFNGTKNFKKNELVDYLQTIGVKFGAHVNAYTSFDETVYRLTIPTDKKAEVEQGFQILEDWAFNVTLTDEEINKERGVVIEEYRTRLGAENRMEENYLPKMLYNSRYAERLPIGKKEILENFEPETLRRFYKDWYRPDLMAVIAVGDISVEELEAKIKEHFDKDIKKESTRERKYYKDESHQNTLISIVSDKEATENTVTILYKNPEIQAIDNSELSQEKKLKESIFSIMINNRFNELANSNEPPFIEGIAQNSESYVKNKESYKLYSEVINKDYSLAIKTLLTENERIKKFGFTKTEFERAKEIFMIKLNRFLTYRGTQGSKDVVSQMKNNFLEGAAMPSPGWSNNFNRSALPKILLEDINVLINEYLRDDNRVVIVKGKEKLITEKEITDIILAIEKDKNIKPYEDIVLERDLFSEELKPGKITNEEKNNLYDITTITLSNGVKVHYKKRWYGNVSFNCKSKGGTSLYSTEDYFESYHALKGLTQAGVGGFSKNELTKLLAGNSAVVYPSVYNQLEMMEGSSTPADLETLFQLIYLNFTQLNKDKAAFNAYKERAKSGVENKLAKPENYFVNEFNKFQYVNDERYVFEPTKEDYDATNYDLAYDIYQKRFENAADFNFVFFGNFEEQTLIAYAKKYLANLPTTSEREMYKERKMNALSGNFSKTIYKGSEEKAKVEMVYRGNYAYNIEEKITFDVLKDILKIKLTEKLREEESGVYSTSVSNRFDQMYNSYSLKVRFECAPENVDKLIAVTKEEIAKIIANGPVKTDLNKVKETILLERKSTLHRTHFWLATISDAAFFDTDVNEIKKYEKRINALSTKDIQAIAQKFLDKGVVVGILLPEKI